MCFNLKVNLFRPSWFYSFLVIVSSKVFGESMTTKFSFFQLEFFSFTAVKHLCLNSYSTAYFWCNQVLWSPQMVRKKYLQEEGTPTRGTISNLRSLPSDQQSLTSYCRCLTPWLDISHVQFQVSHLQLEISCLQSEVSPPIIALSPPIGAL